MKLGDFNRLQDDEILEELSALHPRSFTDSGAGYPRNGTTHGQFSRQANKTPHSVGVADQYGERTYKELETASNRFAKLLISRGIQREEIVGVMVEKTFEMLALLLGIMKAGAAYLPIDHKVPNSRIQYFLQDTRARFLISEQCYKEQLNELHSSDPDLNILTFGEDFDPAAENTKSEPSPERTSADGTAYVMYTSGTTGRPRGVMIPHRAILRLVLDTNYLDFGTPLHILQTGALSFDASTFEIWGALLNGGRFYRPPEHAILDAAELKSLIQAQNITTMFVTSGLFNQLVEMDAGVFNSLTTVLTGGERTSTYHVNRVRRASPQVTLLNVYGPTENTTFTSFYPINEFQDNDIPIGQPVSNSQIHILDTKHYPVPIGVAGEICASGDGLARGYLNDPALTAERFIPHPVEAGQRIYRTGDWGRWRTDGEVEFLGRKDQQIKLRGYRIELTEIEIRLSEHLSIKECVVVARDLGKETAVLVAYLTGSESLAVDDVRSYLRGVLPEYMIPGVFIKLDKMPLNRNGKFDRAALPDPELENRLPGTGRVPPVTGTEKELVSIWSTVLNHSDIGVTDDFFTVGGHSLEVVRLISLIQERLSVAVPLSLIFKPATIRDLSQYILDVSRFGVSGIDDAVVLLSGKTEGRKIFAFPPGTGDALGYIQLAELLRPYEFYAFNFLEAETRLADYADLISNLDPEGPHLLFGYSAGGNLAYHVARELESRGRRVSDIVMVDSAQCMRKVVFPEGEVDRVAAAFLNHESVAPYLASPVLREKAYRLIERYYSYMREAVDLHTIKANVHVLLSEAGADQFYDDAGNLLLSSNGWADLSLGRFITYQGQGGHRVMLNPPHLERNAAVLREVLCSIDSVSATVGGGR